MPEEVKRLPLGQQPAFPMEYRDGDLIIHCGGLTKLELFTGLALLGLCSREGLTRDSARCAGLYARDAIEGLEANVPLTK